VASREVNLGEVIIRAQGGDQRAFDVIYTRFADPLHRYLYARCGDATLAEELHGDLWLRVVERLGSFRPPPSGVDAAFAAWLYRIGYNLVIDSVRKRGGPGVNIDDVELASHEPAPVERLIAADESTALRAAIEQLTPDQREVVMMRFFEERSNAEVAALTGRSEGAVKVMQHRALGALARLMKVERH
jgi:RNA polymerase sigma-70 factor (ECF subfamily)